MVIDQGKRPPRPAAVKAPGACTESGSKVSRHRRKQPFDERANLSYHLVWTSHGVELKYSGSIDCSDVIKANSRFFDDPRSDSAQYQINDFTDAVPRDLPLDEVDLICAMDIGGSAYIEQLIVAFAATHPKFIEVIFYYIDILRKSDSSWIFNVFETAAEARAWVNKELRSR